MAKNRRRSTPAASSSSRTSHSRHATSSIPRLLLAFAALVVALSAAAVVLLPPSTSSAIPVVEHMQRFFHHRATSPLVSRIGSFFRTSNSNKIVASPSPYYYSTKNTMSSSDSAANTVDTDSFHPKGSSNTNDAANNKNEPVLPLPAPDEAGAALKLDLGGDGVKLDALGPMVVNTDGSLSRIANWDRMAEIEKKNTLRIIGKRNKARLAVLRGEE